MIKNHIYLNGSNIISKVYMKKCFYIIIVLVFFPLLSLAESPFDVSKHNQNSPVEVTSDMLEVFQEKNIAVFSGNVIATQDNLSMNSAKMTVHYKREQDFTGETHNRISKIEAEGNLILKTPKEKASGDKGDFDIIKGVITITGNVELKSGENVIKGNKFVYDVNTGQSKIISGTNKSGGKNDSGRVRGVFVPEKKNN